MKNFQRGRIISVRKCKIALLSSSAFCLLGMAGGAAAQQAAATGAETVVVTASRAAPSGYQAPTPTVVLGQDVINQQQVSNLGSLLNTLPSFKATISPSDSGVRTQAPGATFADLRGLGSQRTLVLVDGMRMVPQAPANNTGTAVSPDMSQVPSLMVGRMEVVTGGASAQWGSDAVGGVVNILLRNNFDGLEVKAQGGISEHGDAGNERLAAIYGTDLGSSGHLVVAVDASQSDVLGDYTIRDWAKQAWAIVTVPGTNPAQQILSPNVLPVSTPGGLISSAGTAATRFSLLGDEFLPGGTLQAFNFGSNGAAQITTSGTNRISPTLQIGGEGQPLAKGISLAPAVQRLNPYLYASFPLGASTVLFVEAGYGLGRGKGTVLPSRDSASDTIAINNFFLTQLPQYNSVILPAMNAAGITSFSLSRINYDLGGSAVVTIANTTPHGAIGAKGSFADPWGTDWQWDTHFGMGENLYSNMVTHNRIRANFTNAVNAVSNGSGGAACASAVAVAAGCVPINLFGAGAPSAAAIAYVTGTAHSHSEYDQTTAAFNLKGEPFALWAGPVSLAAGFEYRREHQRVTADPIATAGGFEAANAAPFAGAFDVEEGYLEAVIPLLKDVPFAQSLDFDSAYRYAQYSTAGGRTTWKEGVNWTVVDGVRLRGAMSRDLRAPALYELFSPGSVSNIPVGQSAQAPTNTSIGNPNLAPEIANTITAGIVLEPALLPGFSASLDYYDIDLKHAITSFTGAQIDSLCLAGQTSLCQYISGPVAAPTAVNAPVLNVASVENQGFDFAAAYHSTLADLFGSAGGGKLDLGLNVTNVQHVFVNLGTGAVVDRAGEDSQLNTFALPHMRMNFTATYSDGPWSATTQILVVGAGKIDNTFNTAGNATITNNAVPAIATLNLMGSYAFGDNWEVFGTINNLFDQSPPPVPSPTLFTLTNGAYYDTIGRAFEIGITAHL